MACGQCDGSGYVVAGLGSAMTCGACLGTGKRKEMSNVAEGMTGKDLLNALNSMSEADLRRLAFVLTEIMR